MKDNFKKYEGLNSVKKKRSISWIAVSMLMLLLILSACANDTTKDASVDQDDGSQGDNGTIKIGVMAPTTGPNASAGADMVNGAEMAVKRINEEGGVLGKDIEIIVEDDGCEPQQSVAAANKLIQEEISIVVGAYCSDGALPASGVLYKEGMPFVSVAANSHQLVEQDYDNIFVINGMVNDQGRTIADYFDQENIVKVAIIHDNSDYGRDLADITKEYHEELGGEIIAFEAINPEEKDFGALATKLKSIEPEATYFTGFYNAGGLLRKQFLQKEVPGLFLAGDANAPEPFKEISGEEAALGVLVSQTVSIHYVDTPEAEAFIEEYVETYDSEPLIFGHRQYDGIRFAADVIERAGTATDKEAILQQIRDTEDFPAIGETYKFNDDGTRADADYMIIEITEDGAERVY